jgi:YYY domain-containing protein
MIEVLRFWLVVQLFALAALPLAWRLFGALPSRGYALAKPLGLLLVTYVLWMGGSLGLLRNSVGGVLASLALVAAVSFWLGRAGFTAHPSLPTAHRAPFTVHRSPLPAWLRANRRLILLSEVLFLAAMALWALVRSYSPEITTAGGEKWMELTFLNGILRSESFPPQDPWLAGYGISYYYFGYVMLAALTQLSGLAPSVAFNVGLATWFGLTAVAAFGVAYDMAAALLAPRIAHPVARIKSGLAYLAGLLGALFVVLLGNLAGFLESIQGLGLGSTAFWRWLDIKDLNCLGGPGFTEPLANCPQATSLLPERFYWWWRASRVINDRDLAGNAMEVIDEFPFFSFLLGDMHPHVLGLPFVLLAVGLALALVLHRSPLTAHRSPLTGLLDAFPMRGAGFVLAALCLGGLAFLNTWDFPIYVFLVMLALGAALAWRQGGLSWRVAGQAVLGAAALGVAGVVFYLPFYIGFQSQAGGILPNFINPTRLSHFFVMFGPLLAAAILLLLGLSRWLAGEGSRYAEDGYSTSGTARLSARESGEGSRYAEDGYSTSGTARLSARESGEGSRYAEDGYSTSGAGTSHLDGYSTSGAGTSHLDDSPTGGAGTSHLGDSPAGGAGTSFLDDSPAGGAGTSHLDDSSKGGAGLWRRWIGFTAAAGLLPILFLGAAMLLGLATPGGQALVARLQELPMVQQAGIASLGQLAVEVGKIRLGSPWTYLLLAALIGWTLTLLTAATKLRGVGRDSEELGGTQGNSEELGGTQRNSEELGGTQGNSEELGGTQGNSEELGGTQGNSEELGGTQRNSENPARPLAPPVPLAPLVPLAPPVPPVPLVPLVPPVPLAPPAIFALLLLLTALLLTFSVEFVYLRDTFGTRMNTVFKFYYQAWVLLALVAAFSVAWLARFAGRALRWGGLTLIALLTVAGLFYPALATYTRAERFQTQPTLDGAAYLARQNPADAAAAAWLRQNVTGVARVLEAYGGSYTYAGRISAQTGLPTLLGWEGHELQWRGDTAVQEPRKPIIQRIYGSATGAELQGLLNQWQIDYVLVGDLERQVYGVTPQSEARLAQIMDLVYDGDGVRIYRNRQVDW